jgi:hypothetical protein
MKTVQDTGEAVSPQKRTYNTGTLKELLAKFGTVPYPVRYFWIYNIRENHNWVGTALVYFMQDPDPRPWFQPNEGKYCTVRYLSCVVSTYRYRTVR